MSALTINEEKKGMLKAEERFLRSSAVLLGVFAVSAKLRS